MNHVPMLSIKRLSVSIESLPLLVQVSLDIMPGTVHALMGPNGSGKSSFAYALMGHPRYTVSDGQIFFNGEDITALPADKRAKKGMLLMFQNPCEIPGVSIATFLKEAYQATTGTVISAKAFTELLHEKMALLQIDTSFATRSVNEGFSGGEKKRFEMLQALVLQPKLLIIDEIDSGLDVDALRIVANGLNVLRKNSSEISFLLITHYHRILDYITPDYVHIMQKGMIINSGTPELAHSIERAGYIPLSEQR